ncbi:hypothetical protein Gohar_024875, partial [Gossypium harknessii]|nr:hypothetical protein [Gossypium harknessii]
SKKAARRVNILKVVFESDCAILVNRINRKGRDITIIGQCMDKARMKLGSFSSVDVNASGRSDNFSANQAHAHRNVANESGTKFSRSICLMPSKLATTRRRGLPKPLPAFETACDPSLGLAQPSPYGILPIVVLVPSGCGVPSFIVLFTPLPIHLLGGLLADAPCYSRRAVEPHSSSLSPIFLQIELKGPCNTDITEECYLVFPASSHMFVSKIKPYMCKYEQIQTVKLRLAALSDNRSNSRANTCNKPRLLEGMHLLDKRSMWALPVALIFHNNSTDRTTFVLGSISEREPKKRLPHPRKAADAQITQS